jgi:hypothetical protein
MTSSPSIPTSALSGTLPVANGGTGVTSLTGYIYGNGPHVMSSSPSIPTSALSGTLLVENGGTGVTTSTGTGNFVLSNNPTLHL